jgi:hypothetical protein
MLSRVRTLAIGAGLGALIVVLTPVWFIHQTVTRRLGARKRPAVHDISRVAAGDADLNEIERTGRPVVITGLLEQLELETPPTLAGLRSLGTGASSEFTVKTHKRHSPYFLYVGDYGAELDHTSKMDINGFLDVMFEQPPDPDRCTYKLFSVDDIDGGIGRIIDEMSDALSELIDRVPDRRASGVWIGSEGAVTPLHHDAWTGILFQTEGSKRVAMYSPADRANLYFSSPFDATSRWSKLPGRSADADPAEFPRFARATRHETILRAGEALFIPPFWSHEIEALEANVSIPFRFTTQTVNHLNPGFLRPAFEIFHQKFLAKRAA